MKLRPLKLSPVTKSYIWGGTKLINEWGKTSLEPTIAECWELSMFPGCESVVDDIAFRDYTLSTLYQKYPDFFGEKIKNFDDFPILIKLIDASNNLSVQVHPSDEYALKNEGSLGKTEMWYIADAEEGASIYYGFNRDVTREEVETAIKNNTVTELLNKVDVKKGDAYFVPSGTVHALLRGVTVIEVQESSNLTYRVYDYDRRDKNGNPRELHIEKALNVMNFARAEKAPEIPAKIRSDGTEIRKLAECSYFTVKEVKVNGGEYIIYTGDCFKTFTVAEGTGKFSNGTEIHKGETWFLPAEYMEKITGDGLTLIVTAL